MLIESLGKTQKEIKKYIFWLLKMVSRCQMIVSFRLEKFIGIE